MHFAIGVLFVVATSAAVASATYSASVKRGQDEMRELLRRTLKTNAEMDEPQSVANWVDTRGIEHRLMTPRYPGEDGDAWRRRYEEAITAFTEIFPVKK